MMGENAGRAARPAPPPPASAVPESAGTEGALRRAHQSVQRMGEILLDAFHYLALFGIGATVVWSAVHEYLQMIAAGYATLEDILLLFIYLELGSMVGIYFKTHRLPVQFLIYIAITALSRHLVIDVQKVSDNFHLYLLLSITAAIAILSLAIHILSLTARKYGGPEEAPGGDAGSEY